jgi:PKD repeat protein
MLLLFSCWDDSNISYRDAEYPEQLIFMPTAALNNGQCIIDDINRVRGELPIEGNPYKYVVDVAKKEFRVPLAVYRSGINNKGVFTVDIHANTNIIATINEDRDDKCLLIPSTQYSLVNSVEMKNGAEIAQFDLIVDLDLLRNNYPGEIYALGVEISSTERETNPSLSTTVVIIHTKIVKPTADFTFSIDATDSKKVFFNNVSLMSNDYQWNFGDGSAISNEVSPSHVYSATGTYTVTLTAIGITGGEDKSIISEVITVE